MNTTGSPDYYTLTVALPVTFRPTQGRAIFAYSPYTSTDTYDADEAGSVVVDTNGIITVNRQADQGDGWGTNTGAGWASLSITYNV